MTFGELEGEGRPATIGYYVTENPDGKSFSLWRSDATGMKPDETKKTEDGFIICKNIETFHLTFYDSAGGENDTWETSAGGGMHQGKVPEAVKIELALVNDDDAQKPYKFMTRVFLPVNK